MKVANLWPHGPRALISAQPSENFNRPRPLRGTSRGFAGLRGASRGFAGLRGTSRDFAGLRGTSRSFGEFDINRKYQPQRTKHKNCPRQWAWGSGRLRFAETASDKLGEFLASVHRPRRKKTRGFHSVPGLLVNEQA